ncbi:MAG: hypothetical protein PVI31_03380 [Gemmatimonadota bacterium]|jgi:hypothetical protein
MFHLARTTRSTLLAVLAAATLAGCAGGQSVGTDLPQWSVVEEVRITGATNPNQGLGEVSAIAVDEDGEIYIPLFMQGTILVYDDEGTPLRRIGERGSDPGEFDRIYGLGLIGDTLYAIDFGLRRISYFTQAGELLRTQNLTPTPVDPPFAPGMPFAVFPDGSMAIGSAWAPTVDREALRRVPQLRIEPDGQRVDTVAWLGYDRTGRRVEDERGRPLPVGSPLSDDAFAIFAMDGSRLVSIDRTLPNGSGPATYGVAVSDGWGDTIYSRRYEYEPIEIDESVIDQTVAAGAARIEGAFGSPAEAEDFVRGAMFLPTHYPPVNNAVFTDEGMLWLQREPIPGQPQRWMVLDEAGEPVAEAALPANFRVVVIRNDSIWGIAHDAAGATHVVRYGIERTG